MQIIAQAAQELFDHNQQLIVEQILAQPDQSAHYSLKIDLIELCEINFFLGQKIIRKPYEMFPLLDEALQIAQRKTLDLCDINSGLSLKPYAHVRFIR